MVDVGHHHASWGDGHSLVGVSVHHVHLIIMLCWIAEKKCWPKEIESNFSDLLVSIGRESHGESTTILGEDWRLLKFQPTPRRCHDQVVLAVAPVQRVLLSFCLAVFLYFCLSSFCLSVFLSFCLLVFCLFAFFLSFVCAESVPVFSDWLEKGKYLPVTYFIGLNFSPEGFADRHHAVVLVPVLPGQSNLVLGEETKFNFLKLFQDEMQKDWGGNPNKIHSPRSKPPRPWWGSKV